MNNLSVAPTNNQNQKSYNFKQMDNNPNAPNPTMPGNLRGTFNNNIQNNFVNGSISSNEPSQDSNNPDTPATAQVQFLDINQLLYFRI